MRPLRSDFAVSRLVCARVRLRKVIACDVRNHGLFSALAVPAEALFRSETLRGERTVPRASLIQAGVRYFVEPRPELDFE